MNLRTFIDLVMSYQRDNPHGVHVADDLERVCGKLAGDPDLSDAQRRDLSAAADRLRDFVREMPDD